MKFEFILASTHFVVWGGPSVSPWAIFYLFKINKYLFLNNFPNIFHVVVACSTDGCSSFLPVCIDGAFVSGEGGKGCGKGWERMCGKGCGKEEVGKDVGKRTWERGRGKEDVEMDVGNVEIPDLLVLEKTPLNIVANCI
jgi:hypothetical protein